ncbi:MAG TPA: class II SORL domain-containing protein [Dissulfurispiraceae bacterium]|nr:class II SORL domain-containing protein [Dissulfurispiraceae bacterium]
MDRRTFLKAATIGTIAAGIGKSAYAADINYPVKVDPALFTSINKVKDPANKTPLEMTHAPFITAPAEVKAGEPFTVSVSVGEKPHVMGPAHWIEYIELNIGNEPAGRVDFQSKGFLQPKATFTVMLTKEAAPSGVATLVVNQRCNLHGYWEGSLNIKVV